MTMSMMLIATVLAAFQPDTLLYIGQFIIGLGLVVFVHEFGHFLAAKWAGITVEEFALGFGKRLFGVKWRGTDYRLNLLPLGGYVKMLGQDDLKPGEVSSLPGSWQNCPIGKRIVVLTAGVFMNVLSAAIVAVVLYMVGLPAVPPVVGHVSPGMPAAIVALPPDIVAAMGDKDAKGLLPNDKILAINGRKLRKFEHITSKAALSSAGEKFTLTIQRDINGKEYVFDVVMEPRASSDMGTRLFLFGINTPAKDTVGEPADWGYAGPDKFLSGDKIVGLAGKPVVHPWDIEVIRKTVATDKVDVLVERDGQQVTLPVRSFFKSVVIDPNPENVSNPLTLLGMATRVELGFIVPGSPAEKAGLKAGDVVLSYGDTSSPTRIKMMDISKQLAGKEVDITVLRGKEEIRTKVTPKKDGDKATIGFLPEAEQSPPVVAEVQADSVAAKAGISPGAVITAVNDTPVTSWLWIYDALKKSADKPIKITYSLGDSEHVADLGVLTKDQFNTEEYALDMPALQRDPFLVTLITKNPGEAIVWAMEDTKDFIVNTYQSLVALATRRVPTSEMRGPIGIGDAAVKIGRKGTIHLIYLFVMLSAAIAVFNFLPIPPLDGGHVLFAIIEKIRGKPLPLKLLVAVQYTGWIAFLLLFVAITWQDVMRLIKGG